MKKVQIFVIGKKGKNERDDLRYTTYSQKHSCVGNDTLFAIFIYKFLLKPYL